MKTPAGKTSYPSDLNEAEWAILDPLIPRARRPGRPEKYPKRSILNAVFYLVRSGCAWRMRPNDLPPWKLVWHYFPHWKKQGVWARLNDALRDAVRLQAGKKSPDRCDPRRTKRAHKKDFALEKTHPIHRALALEKALCADASLTPQALAVREKLSPATVSQLRKLARLSPAVQSELLKITNRAQAWRYSIRRLLPLVGRPLREYNGIGLLRWDLRIVFPDGRQR